MKNKILFIVSIVLFFVGIIFKFTILPFGGTLLALGLTLFIIWITIFYGSKDKLTLKDIFSMFVSVVMAAWVFKFIQSRVYLEIFIVAFFIGLISFLTTFILKKKKSQ